jgi:4'-phosphopantetheinyl transferase
MAMMQTPDVTVWTVALDADLDPAWRQLGVLLDVTERARAARFVFERHRRTHVVAHALKRLMLSAIAGFPPQSWTFDAAPGGKPRISPVARPQFNIAHSEGLVACTVSEELELGVDVEPISRSAPLELAKTQFAEPEQRWIDGLPPPDRAIGFLRLWTLKEAFIKATGRGLAQPLQAFSFAFEPLRVNFHDPALGNSRAWHFEQREISGHLLALAWRKSSRDPSMEIRERRLETLLAEAIQKPECP